MNKSKKHLLAIGCLAVVVIFFILMHNRGVTNNGNKGTDESSNSILTGNSSTPTKQWYEGGTLHNKSAFEWQNASKEDKLATCSDFVTKMWQDDNLKPAIANNLSTVEDVRPYAQELVNFLDAAFKPDPDPEQNRKLFANQTVAGTAAIGMVTMGWTKSFASADSKIFISKNDINPWPLTVDSGYLYCKIVATTSSGIVMKAILFESNGKIYALNGTARSRKNMNGKRLYPDIDPIWKNDPNYSEAKINIGPLITKGLSLCD